MGLKQRKAATEFSGTFPDETVQKWREMVKGWQEDPSRPNPYVSTERGSFYFQLNSVTTSYSHFQR